MSLDAKLRAREEGGRPIRVGLIGAGKFGSMFLAQAPRTPGLHVMPIADLSPDRARQSLRRVGWADRQFGPHSLADSVARGTPSVADATEPLITAAGTDAFVPPTGLRAAAVPH